ncbi:MAG: leader peptidase (prepilin peptidase) / N-methyltransferase [Chloroflexota bacterium]|jgi:leader peptidase (prepilin peptidase)/N-methyltransferase|nr:leader peptidase (prepilin peptidase) / N-methyltransferase [Chloroflexota bacterium]
MNNLVLALVAAVLGAAAGFGTHRLNEWFIREETEDVEPPLPAEFLWAPVLDAAVLGMLFYRFGLNPHSIVGAVVVLVLVQVLVFDARHRLILSRVIYPAALVALLVSPVSPLLLGTWQARLLASVSGALVAGGLFFLMYTLTRGGFGLGDANLAFFMGAVLGGLPLPVPPIALALIWGIFGGGIISALLLVTRVRRMRDFIPYGPFLCGGAILALLYPCGLFGATTC